MWPHPGHSQGPFNPAFPPPRNSIHPVLPNTGFLPGQNLVYPPAINPAIPPNLPCMSGGPNPNPTGSSFYNPPPGPVYPDPYPESHGGFPMLGIPGAAAEGLMVTGGHKKHKKMKKAKKKAHKAEKAHKPKKHGKHSSSSSSSSSDPDCSRVDCV